MATFQWYDGNGGIWGYQDNNLFDITTMTTSQLVGTYNGSDGPYDPNSHAWSFEAALSGAALYTFQTGPNAGNQIYNAGTLTGLNFFNSSHSLLMSVTGLAINLPSFMALGAQGVYLWDMVTQGPNTYLGSNNSMSNGWDGDDITTGSGDDLVKAFQGDDFISDRGGADVYRGGLGFDTVNYDNWKYLTAQMISGISVNLGLGTIVGPDGKTDLVFSIESVRGTHLNDTFIGNAFDNDFMGLQGNDTFRGGLGFDTISYARDARNGGTDGVLVNLITQTAHDGFGNTDTVINIEGARGTNQNDILIDDAKDNWFRGDDGNDIFKFRGGNDQAVGGLGADNFQFLGGAFGNDTIEDFSQADGDKITIQGAVQFANLTLSQSGTDTIIDWNGNSITLWDVTASSLTAGDFVFI